MIKNKKICYFLKSGRQKRITNNHPDEFLYGFNYFRKIKLDISVIYDTDLGFNTYSHSKILSIINMLIYWFIGVPGKSLIILLFKRKVFLQFDIIIVTTNTFGLSIAFLKKIRLLKADIFFISMGLITDKTPFFWIFIYKWILKGCKVVTLSYQDSQFLETKLNYKIDYINFGVDKEFWKPLKSDTSYDYVISIGNDLNRDYKTLIDTWSSDYPLLKIITNHKITTNKKNVEIILGDWATEIFSDKAIRKLIRESLFVVLPIIDTIQPSGQSVALQSMSSGKTVIITDFKGLWNRDLIQDHKNIILSGRPGEKNKLEYIITYLLKNKNLLKKIGENARLVVEKKLNSDNMANEMLEILEDFAIVKKSKKD